MYRSTLLAVGLLALASCTTPNPTEKVTVAFELSTPRAHQPYLISPGDELEVLHFDTPKLNMTVPVRPDGNIALPLVGRVVAEGRTPEALSLEIEQRLGTELRNPRVTIVVRGFVGRRVHIGGEVGRPGPLVLVNRTTVLEALLTAGGPLDTAHLEQVLVMRRNAKPSTRDSMSAQPSARPPAQPSVRRQPMQTRLASYNPTGRPESPHPESSHRESPHESAHESPHQSESTQKPWVPYRIVVCDLTKALDGTDTTQNLELRPDDLIIVPKSAIANVNVWIDQYVRRNLPFNVTIRPDVNL
tara:strand:- start:1160 stop:2062 length:903 start_codon:yes stop_codon:yes gene_type:complete